MSNNYASPPAAGSPSGANPTLDSDGTNYQSIFAHVLNGMTYCKMLFDRDRPRDFIFLYNNPAFEHQTGISGVCGKRVTEVIPGIHEHDPRLFEILGRIARGGAPEQFEIYINALSMWLSISAYSPGHEHFVAIFDVISERKLTEEILRASEERYLDVFDNTSDLIQCVSPDGMFIYTNRAWRETLGYTEQEVQSISLFDVLHPDSMACCQARFERLLMGESVTDISFKFLTKSGKTIHLTGDCGSFTKDGSIVSTRGIFKDITDTIEAETALKITEARYQALYENAPDIFSTINRAGEILSINRTGASMLGYDHHELIGESAAKVIHPEDQRAVFEYMERQFAGRQPDPGIEYRKLRKDNSSFWVHQRVTLDPDPRQERLLVLCRDVTERRNLEEQLAHQAAHDTLTNLINRREFERRLQRILAHIADLSEEHVLCYLDLDQFKIINDSCGHGAGDELLRQIASLLQGQMRSRDTLCRLGGDEFVVLMEHCSIDRATRLADKIRTTIHEFQFHWRDRQFSVGISAGLLAIQPGHSIADMLSLADSACYRAKKRGGNCIHVHSRHEALICDS